MEQALVVIEQKEVEFYGDTIVAVRTRKGDVHVSVRPICDLTGVDLSAQRRRISRDPVPSDLTMSVAITTTDMPTPCDEMGLQLPWSIIWNGH